MVVCDLIKRIIDSKRYQPDWTTNLIASMRGALDKFKLMKSMTPMYMQQLLPLELAILAAIVPFPPFQVPYVRLNREQIPVYVNISRQRPQFMTQPGLSLGITNVTVGVPIGLDARAITVAMLSGEYPSSFIMNTWYAEKLYPLFLKPEFCLLPTRDVILTEAYNTLVVMLSQVANIPIQIDHPLDWIPSLEFSASTAGRFAEDINNAFKIAFDLSDALLEPLLIGDPRSSQLAIQYQMMNGESFNVVPAIPNGTVGEAFLLTSTVFSNEYNLFSVGRGDVILGLSQSTGMWSPLSPPSSLVFDRNTPGVHIFGRESAIAFGLNGLSPTIRDADGYMVPFEGNWIFPLSLWQMNNRFFNAQLDQWIRNGSVRIRIELGAYPYVLHYYDPQQYVNGWPLVYEWLQNITPTGLPAIPFLVPESRDYDISSAPVTQFLIATEYNDGSLFCTNSNSPTTRAGPDKHIPIERYRVLSNEGVDPSESQLPRLIEFYNLFRRYAYDTPPVSGIVTVMGPDSAI